MMEHEDSCYLTPTGIIDSDHESIQDFATKISNGMIDPVEIAVKLYLAVHDGILYDPYSPFYLPEHYRGSYVLKQIGRAHV